MSELWICREQTAKRPFRLMESGVEITTIEELCYYLYQNIEHLDEEILDESLLVWISEELKLPKLSASLKREQDQGRDVLWCVWILLKEIGMYSDVELAKIQPVCIAIENKEGVERWKLKADRLLSHGKYVRSIGEYQRLIELDIVKNQYPMLLGDVWHNLGVAYTRLFLFEEAAECFRKAYQINLRKESLWAYEEALDVRQSKYSEEEIRHDIDWGVQLQELKEEYRRGVI